VLISCIGRVRLHGQFCGRSHDPTMVLEVVASCDLCIWNCFFLDSRDHSVTSMSYIDPIYLLDILVGMLRLATTKSMDMTISFTQKKMDMTI
jgi:hypothetical protein